METKTPTQLLPQIGDWDFCAEDPDIDGDPSVVRSWRTRRPPNNDFPVGLTFTGDINDFQVLFQWSVTAVVVIIDDAAVLRGDNPPQLGLHSLLYTSVGHSATLADAVQACQDSARQLKNTALMGVA